MIEEKCKVLSLDSGGSKMDLLLGEVKNGQVHLLGRSRLAPIRLAEADLENAKVELEARILEFLTEQESGLDEIASAVLVLAGMGDPAKREGMEAWAWNFFDGPSQVVSDIEFLLSIAESMAAEEADSAFALISGTGSIVAGIRLDSCETDSFRSAGGLGPLLGDEGSGFWIGKSAIQRSIEEIRNSDRLEETESELATSLMSKFGVDTPRELVAQIHQTAEPVSALASLAPWVGKLAEQGDPLASSIINEAASHLADMFRSVRKQLGEPEQISMAVSGGVVLGLDSLRDSLAQELAHEGVNAESVTMVEDPAKAALTIAMMMLEG